MFQVVGLRSTPSHVTTALGSKLLPVTVSDVGLAPSDALFGVMLLTTGVASITLKRLMAALWPPPGSGL